MQLMFDTSVDSPAQIYKMAIALAAAFEVVEAPAQDASPEIVVDKEPSIVAKWVPEFVPEPVREPLSTLAPLFSEGPLAAQKPLAFVVDSVPPPPPPPGPAPAPALDSQGVAWSAALHSSTKSQTIDGRWVARRSRTPKVTADTAATPPAPPAPPAPAPAPPVPSGAGSPVQLSTPLPPPAPVPPAPLAPVAAIPLAPNTPPPPVVDEDVGDVENDVDFPTFIGLVTSGMTDGSLTQKRIDEVLTLVGAENLFGLASDPVKLGNAVTAFGWGQ